MFNDYTLVRLIVSQIFILLYMLMMVPLKTPQRRSRSHFIFGSVVIVVLNAWVIVQLGISFYISFYFFTLTLPYILMLNWVAQDQLKKVIFALLTIQVFGNMAIIHGLLASYLFAGENHPLIDTLARTLTYLLFLPLVAWFVRPIYFRMLQSLKRGWWLLNVSLIIAYALAYVTLFVPDAIFNRPEYFIHGYIGIVLALFIYAIILMLFIEVDSKVAIEIDKTRLSLSLEKFKEETEKMSTLVGHDHLTSIKNRFALFQRLDVLIHQKTSFDLLFLDLNDFKAINDHYGHLHGDLTLKAVALGLQSYMPVSEDVYRYAGDEFICLIPTSLKKIDLKALKTHLKETMKDEVHYLGLSAGLANYPQDAQTADELISLADRAMYRDKNDSAS